MKLSSEWKELLIDYLRTPAARELAARVDAEYKAHTCCPAAENIFAAYNICPPQNVRVVILGQDPYFNANQAIGMSFAINPASKCLFPPSLTNIIKEVTNEYGACAVTNGDLTPWARQGVLLLNTCLTVRMGTPLSHADIGWDGFTRAAIEAVAKMGGVVFLLWGAHAKKYGGVGEIISPTKNLILTCAHPSPLSASNGFFGCGHFKKANEFLKSIDKPEIKW